MAFLLPGFLFSGRGERIDKRERLLYHKLHDLRLCLSKRVHLTQSTAMETEFIQIFKQLL